MSELNQFQSSLDKVNDDLERLLSLKHVGFRNSKENLVIVNLQRQKRILEKKVEELENSGGVIAGIKDSTVPEIPEEIPAETSLEQGLDKGVEENFDVEHESQLPPLEVAIMCTKCNEAPTKDPSKLCAICKSKRDYKSRIPEHS